MELSCCTLCRSSGAVSSNGGVSPLLDTSVRFELDSRSARVDEASAVTELVTVLFCACWRTEERAPKILAMGGADGAVAQARLAPRETSMD